MIIDSQLKDQLEQLAHSPQGQALLRYLEQTREEMSNLKTIESWEETLGRKKALEKIDELFSFMGEKKVEIKTKNQYM